MPQTAVASCLRSRYYELIASFPFPVVLRPPTQRRILYIGNIAMPTLTIILALSTVFFYSRIAIGGALPSPRAPFTQDHAQRRARLGGVTSLSGQCSQIGVDMLKLGGNAADAVCCFASHLMINTQAVNRVII